MATREPFSKRAFAGDACSVFQEEGDRNFAGDLGAGIAGRIGDVLIALTAAADRKARCTYDVADRESLRRCASGYLNEGA